MWLWFYCKEHAKKYQTIIIPFVNSILFSLTRQFFQSSQNLLGNTSDCYFQRLYYVDAWRRHGHARVRKKFLKLFYALESCNKIFISWPHFLVAPSPPPPFPLHFPSPPPSPPKNKNNNKKEKKRKRSALWMSEESRL